ncbi:hypothetical protein [Dactylosporangium sp. CA-139066]|uniref:hypothetical protein n=1 Tax=Dactylosporangium sp. CA-139066 TaxID=3239930 RepID=UPI003D92C001
MTGWLCGASALLLTWVVYETLKNMIAKEMETRLERLPYAILRLARRRLPAEYRQTVHDEEWLPELIAIVRDTDGLPITRLIRGVDFAMGLLLVAPKMSRALGWLRRAPKQAAEVRPDGIEVTVSVGKPTVGPTIPEAQQEQPYAMPLNISGRFRRPDILGAASKYPRPMPKPTARDRALLGQWFIRWGSEAVTRTTHDTAE